jgi:queuine tRNA-ribosyltransferase
VKFELEYTDGKARSGSVTTDHGVFATPAFMPVGTQGTVKAMSARELNEVGAQIILGNTYHLYLRPGTDILFQAGGLHRFAGWDKAILTDSGGYQVFSLSDLRTIKEDGVEFRSHLDGSKHFFTPEKVIEIQRVLGSDIMMVLDECAPYPCDEAYAERSNDLTIRWARRCYDRFKSSDNVYDHTQSLFAVVQGSTYPRIRQQSIDALMEIDFDGYAIGGLAVGEPMPVMYDIVNYCTDTLPADRPRYLMGVGTPENLLECIERGVDMFDCVLPTRNGRNGMVFSKNGALTITNAQYKSDFTPIDESCGCYACRNVSRAYIRHLFQVKEILGLHLTTMHNLYFYQWLLAEARQAIAHGTYSNWKTAVMDPLRQTTQQVS